MAGSQVPSAPKGGKEEVFGVLVSLFLRKDLSQKDPEWTMFYFLGSWRKELPDSDATKNLATKERREAMKFALNPSSLSSSFADC